MSLHTARRRSLAAALTVIAASLVAVGGSVASASDGGPAASCSELLEQAANWPGGEVDNVRLVSMSYVHYQERQPACASPEA